MRSIPDGVTFRNRSRLTFHERKTAFLTILRDILVPLDFVRVPLWHGNTIVCRQPARPLFRMERWRSSDCVLV